MVQHLINRNIKLEVLGNKNIMVEKKFKIILFKNDIGFFAIIKFKKLLNIT